MAGFASKLQVHSGDGSKGPIVLALCVVFQVFFATAVSGLPTASAVNCVVHDTYLPHPNNCNKFYKCVWGEAVSMDCPSKLVFNVDRNLCDWEANVNCNNGVRPRP